METGVRALGKPHWLRKCESNKVRDIDLNAYYVAMLEPLSCLLETLLQMLITLEVIIVERINKRTS